MLKPKANIIPNSVDDKAISIKIRNKTGIPQIMSTCNIKGDFGKCNKEKVLKTGKGETKLICRR